MPVVSLVEKKRSMTVALNGEAENRGQKTLHRCGGSEDRK